MTRISLVAALLAATALGAAAQTTRSITGVVRDGSGLVVAGATVIAAIEDSGPRQPTLNNQSRP